MPDKDDDPHNDLVMSFLSVRRAIGILGYFLPFALLVFALLSPLGLPDSISSSYYTPMREIFIGTLCAQAVFLWSYVGYPGPGKLINDFTVSRIASISIALVALAPTKYDAPNPTEISPEMCTLLQCILGNELTAYLHLSAALCFFLSLAVFCLVLFVQGNETSPEKRASNQVYRICGVIILICIGLIGILFATGLIQQLSPLKPVFWLEFIATMAFATSWMVKGDALLGSGRAKRL